MKHGPVSSDMLMQHNMQIRIKRSSMQNNFSDIADTYGK